jgi:hypothetical protein
MIRRVYVIGLILLFSFAAGCHKISSAPEVIKTIPVDSMEGVLTQSGVTFDQSVSIDGHGSLRINASEPVTVRLYELRDVQMDDARLIYSARLKTENLKGQAYIEMWCSFPGLGEYFSRSLQNPLSGTVDWATLETPFFLQKGQRPELVKLNVVINGQGTVWIDDISLIKGALK